MEVKTFVKKISEQELNLETESGEEIIIPKLMLADAKIDQVVYVACNLEPDQAARVILNELLLKND